MGLRAGFSRGLASRKYGSKDGLIEAVIWRVSDLVNGQVDRAIEGTDDPLQQLLALFDSFVDLALHDTSVRAYFVLFAATIANRLETRSVFDEIERRFGARIEALDAVKNAELRVRSGGILQVVITERVPVAYSCSNHQPSFFSFSISGVTGTPPSDSTKVAPRLSSRMITRFSGRVRAMKARMGLITRCRRRR